MDDSRLLGASTEVAAEGWSGPADGDGAGAEVEHEIQCTCCVNWDRVIDVSCGLSGAVLLVYSASCAVDPLADDFSDANCLAGYWYIGIILVSALVFCRPLHQVAKEAPPPPGGKPLACTWGRAADVTAGFVGTAGVAYGSSCGVAAVVASGITERGLEDVCLADQWWTIPMLLALLLIMRPLWSLTSRICPLDSLYRSCHKWRCCNGCSWLFPLLCLGSFACLTYGHLAVNTIVFGVTNAVRSENGTETSFWSGVRDNAENGQWFVLFLAVFFNVIILYVCLVIMVFCWFSPWRRGALVTAVCLTCKWCAFHQYSNLVNAISLAFELIVPIIAPNGIWLEAVAGLGVVYQTLGLLFTISLVEVLLYTYAHTPRRVSASKSEEGEDDSNSWSFGDSRDSDSDSGGRYRLSRRASAARIGYNNHASNEGEMPQALFKRVDARKDRERAAAGWQATVSGESYGVSCDCSGKICAVFVQVFVPFCLAGFFVCFYVATFTAGTLEFDFVTDIPCQLGGLLCARIEPAPVNCVETILRNSGRVVAQTGGDFTACGDYTQSLAELYVDVWNSQVGYQHDLFPCPNGDDDCPQPGPPCNEGLCQPGPIILATNRVFAVALTLGPIVVMPQLQMLVAAVVWFVPMKARQMAHCILAMHMLLAWSTLDVWTVTLAVRMGDLERYSIKAQEATCEEFGETLDPPASVCFGAIGVLGAGYYFLIPACVMQWIAALYVSYEGAGVILQAAGEDGAEVRCNLSLQLVALLFIIWGFAH